MKYALLTDNSVQWFGFLVSISEEGKCYDYHPVSTGIKCDYLSSIYSRPLNFTDLELDIPSQPVNKFYGIYISEYEFNRLVKIIRLYPETLEYERLGRLEKI